MDELSFGQWLCRQRKSLGLTQKQLAEQISCATITVRKIEAEQRHPSVQIVDQLVQVLNIPSKEHDSFLRFARGYSQSAPKDPTEISPWLSSTGPFDTDQPHLLLSLPEVRHTFLPGGMYELDANSERIGAAVSPVTGDSRGTMQDDHGTAPDLTDGAYLLLVIPVKILDQAMLSALQSLQESIRTVETSLKPARGSLVPRHIVEAIH